MTEDNRLYRAAIYLRLSKEDGDGEESLSISNQRALAMEFLSKNPDISFAEEMVDDGYSGANFERPGFEKLLAKINCGEVDCVIVKDLSRFGRDYIDTGYYLEKLFPLKGVRFISVNDKIDSKTDNGNNARLVMEIKNVMNDSYIRDISIKVRSQLEIKRKNGEYIGAFAAYGYVKSAEDKHKLEPDENAAKIVKAIFKMRLGGMSGAAIAKRLNFFAVPPPAEYKRLCGSNYKANFRKKYKSEWSAKAVMRILNNEIYTGTLIQGVHTTASYKVKKLTERDKSEWSVVKDSHEAIVTQALFDTVRELNMWDTRSAPKTLEPFLFSGFIECGDCGYPLVRKTEKRGEREYVYYMCSANKRGLGCTSHRVREDVISASVLHALNSHARSISELSAIIEEIPAGKMKDAEILGIDTAIIKKTEETEVLKKALDTAAEYAETGLESETVCGEVCKDIRERIKAVETEISRLKADRARCEQTAPTYVEGWTRVICRNEIVSLNRELVANLIDRICVYEDKRLEIRFKFSDRIIAWGDDSNGKKR